MKVVGGVEAVQHSWPSAVIIKTSYKALADIGGDRVLATVGFSCGGMKSKSISNQISVFPILSS